MIRAHKNLIKMAKVARENHITYGDLQSRMTQRNMIAADLDYQDFNGVTKFSKHVKEKADSLRHCRDLTCTLHDACVIDGFRCDKRKI